MLKRKWPNVVWPKQTTHTGSKPARMTTPYTSSGVSVTNESAFGCSGFVACTTLLSETLMSMPRKLQSKDSKKVIAVDHPVHRLLTGMVNDFTDCCVWFSQLVDWLINYGSYTAYKENRSQDGRVAALWPIHPSRIQKENVVYDADTNEIWFPILPYDNSDTIWIPKSKLCHIAGRFTDDVFNLFGKGAVQMAKEAIGTDIAKGQLMAENAKYRGVPPLALETPHELDAAVKLRMQQDWKNPSSIRDRGNVPILEQGTKIVELGFSTRDAALIEERQFSVHELSRFYYNIPIHLLREKLNNGVLNSEEENIEFAQHCLGPILTRIVTALSTQCLGSTDQRAYEVSISLKGLLRGNTTARTNYYKAMREMGCMTSNDILSAEDEPTIGPDGDIRTIPGSTITLDHAKAQEELAIAKTEFAVANPKEAFGQIKPDLPGNLPGKTTGSGSSTNIKNNYTGPVLKLVSSTITEILMYEQRLSNTSKKDVTEIQARISEMLVEKLKPVDELAISLGMNSLNFSGMTEQYMSSPEFNLTVEERAERYAATLLSTNATKILNHNEEQQPT